jgi:hypothetical protein
MKGPKAVQRKKRLVVTQREERTRSSLGKKQD